MYIKEEERIKERMLQELEQEEKQMNTVLFEIKETIGKL